MSIATRTKEILNALPTNQPRWRWYHAVLFYVIVQVLTFGLFQLALTD